MNSDAATRFAAAERENELIDLLRMGQRGLQRAGAELGRARPDCRWIAPGIRGAATAIRTAAAIAMKLERDGLHRDLADIERDVMALVTEVGNAADHGMVRAAMGRAFELSGRVEAVHAGSLGR